ncbi:MAG TPA: hypothetical protein VGH93_06435 [Solirubrobacteraceae bacterium]
MVRLIVAIGSAAAAVSLVGPPRAAEGVGAYSYGGAASRSPVAGVTAVVALLGVPHVRSGHVAGWVGVGGPGLGPGGADEWIQLGVSAFAGATTGTLYLEVERGAAYRYSSLAAGVAVGDRHRLAVSESPAREGWWQPAVDGSPVGPSVHLPGSHGNWPGQIVAESWSPESAACNGFAFSFTSLAVAGSGRTALTALSRPLVFADKGIDVSRSGAALTARAHCG